MPNRISACLVVFNEEKAIERCLDSIKDVVDEIIIVYDGECGDKTLEICRKYTDKIFIQDHIGEAEPHRAFGFSHASGDWILQIDADEFLSADLKKSIRNLAENKFVDAYEFLWPLWDGKNYITKNWPRKRCLFRKEKISFLGIPHYVAQVNGAIKKNKLILEHRPPVNYFVWKFFKIKYFKWAKIQAEYYLKNFKDIKKYNYHKNDWSLKIKLRAKFPMLLLPAEFIVTLLKNLSSGGYKEGIIGYKYALMISLYRVMVNYYIFIEKLKKFK